MDDFTKQDINIDEIIQKASWEEYDQNIKKQIQLDVLYIINRLRQIRNEIIQLNNKTRFFLELGSISSKATEYESTVADKRDVKKTIEDDMQQRELLFEAYELIQKFRFYLTSEKLSYRFYIATGDSLTYIDVDSSNLEDYVSFGDKRELKIVESRIKKEIAKQTKPSEDQKTMNEKWKDFLSKFKKKKQRNNNWYIYRDEKIKRYQVTDKTYNKNLPKPKSEAVFNLGKIAEAFDIAYYIDNKNPQISTFLTYLKGDSESAFTGGDRGMIQLKANQARLMRFSSIMNGINKVLFIFDNNFEIGKNKDFITKMFFKKEQRSNVSNEFFKRLNIYKDEVAKNLTDNLTIK